MIIKRDNINGEDIFTINTEESELKNNYKPEDDIGRCIYLVINKLKKIQELNIFKADSIYMTDFLDYNIIDSFDKNKFLIISNGQHNFQTNFPFTSDILIEQISRSFEPVSYSFNSFLIIAELEDNIYTIEKNKILKELDINEKNCNSLFDYCIYSSYYDLAFIILNSFYGHILFDEKQIKNLINSNHIELIDLYFSKSNYFNIFLFIKENNIINSIINITESNFFKKNSSDIIHFISKNKDCCSQELILLSNLYHNINNF